MKQNSEVGYADVAELQQLNSKQRRRALGIYYTPPEAAMLLARWAIRGPHETLLEPSFGGCAMLSAAVKVFSDLGNKSPSAQLYGYDVDEAAFTHLAELGVDNNNDHFKKLDFLESSAKGLRVTAVLANPPYVSYHRQAHKQRELGKSLRQRYMPELPRLASLWVYFLLHSMSFLENNGRMAFVLPNAIANADYAHPLLEFLRRRFTHIELIHVTERIFIQEGADERICLLLLTGYEPTGVEPVGHITEHDIQNLAELSLAPGQSRRNIGGNSAIETKKKAVAVLSPMEGEQLQRLGDVASVQIGEVVGDIKFFVRPMSFWKDLKIGKKYLYPLLTRAGQVDGIYPKPWMDDLEVTQIPYLLVPPAKRLPKAISAYLKIYSEAARDSNKTFAKRDRWYQCSYDPGAHAFIGSMTHLYPRIIGNQGDISCSNSFYKITVSENKEVLFGKWLPIIAMSTPFRLSAEILARVRGSGGIKLEPSDVKRLLIPMELPIFSQREFKEFVEKLEELILKSEIEAANALVDSELYIKPKKIAPSLLSDLRKMRMALTSIRLNK